MLRNLLLFVPVIWWSVLFSHIFTTIVGITSGTSVFFHPCSSVCIMFNNNGNNNNNSSSSKQIAAPDPLSTLRTCPPVPVCECLFCITPFTWIFISVSFIHLKIACHITVYRLCYIHIFSFVHSGLTFFYSFLLTSWETFYPFATHRYWLQLLPVICMNDSVIYIHIYITLSALVIFMVYNRHQEKKNTVFWIMPDLGIV